MQEDRGFPFAAPRAAVAALLLLFTSVASGSDLTFERQEDVLFPVGEYFAYSLCVGRPVDMPLPGEQRKKLDPDLTPCGTDFNPSSTVSGGEPPYRFHLDTLGGFPPMGLTLAPNGILRGTLRGTPAPFRVCAVDLRANESCRVITVRAVPRSAASSQGKASGTGGKGFGAPLVLAGAAVAAGAVALSQMDLTGTGGDGGSGGCSSNSDCGRFASRNSCVTALCAEDRLCHCCLPYRSSSCIRCSRDSDCRDPNVRCYQGTCIFRAGGQP